MKSAQFDPRLEAIRGLAALMVAGGHSLVVYPTFGVAGRCTSALRVVLNGNSAVAMFFVLSGLVLGMGLQRQGPGTVREFFAYVTRRGFRIYPVFLLNTIAILLLIGLTRIYGGPNCWFNSGLSYRESVLNSFPGTSVIIGNLLLLNPSLNLVTWTLGVEMFSSLLLPLAHYARVRLPASGTWLLLAASGALVLLGKWFLLFGWVKFEGAFNWNVLGYFYLFFAGYLLPIVGPACFARLKSSRIATRLTLALALCLLLSGWSFDKHLAVAGLGAWMVLGVLLSGFELRAFRFLEWPVVRFIGRISYSFYLLHDLVLIACGRFGAQFIFHRALPNSPFAANLVLLVVSVAVTACLAWAAHRWIELPFIQAGKQWAARLSPRESVRTRDSARLPAPQSIPA